MGNDASSWSPPEISTVWEDLRGRGFSLISDGDLGLPEKFRDNFHQAYFEGERIHKRVQILEDPQAEELARTLLSLIPPERRHPEGTLGVNFFRTYTDVVTRPHHDNEEFIILYVMHRDGDGARSYLFEDRNYRRNCAANPATVETGTSDPAPLPQVLDYQLNPGQLLLFEDARFQHGATALEPPPGSQAMRDVIVFTVDYPETYLQRETAAAN